MNFCLLLLTASCSMEEDVLRDFDKKVVAAGEVYTGVSFHLVNGSDIKTKTTVVEDDENVDSDEAKITKCYVVVANGDKIIGSHTYAGDEIISVSSEYTLNPNIMVKVPEGTTSLKAFVIAYAQDSKNNDFSYITSLSELKNAMIENPCMDFVKTGEVIIQDIKTSRNIVDFRDKENCTAVTASLSLRTAAVQLDEITVKDQHGNAFDVRITSMAIINPAISTSLSGYVKPTLSKEAIHLENSGDRQYIYQNMTSTVTTVMIEYLVNGVTPGSITFPIKTIVGGQETVDVRAGYLYKLNVSIINGVASGICTVNDFKGNTVTGDWIEITD